MLSKLLEIMMSYYNDVRLSEHAVKAYAYASSIGAGENLSEHEHFILCAAAILHDIGIPNAIKLHGSSKGEFQEKEGALLVPSMLEKAGMPGITDRVSWLVGHHHQESLAHTDLLIQILMEADHLVNLAEGSHPKEKAEDIRDSFFRTETGKRYISALFSI